MIWKHLADVEPHLTWRKTTPSAAAIASVAEAALVEPIETGLKVTSSFPLAPVQVQLGPVAAGHSGRLSDVLEERVSERDLGPIDLPDLATLLVRSSRIRSWQSGPDGYQVSHRPVPSAGARHPCDLLVAVSEVEGLASGWWLFEPAACGLIPGPSRLPDAEIILERLVAIGGLVRTPPAAVFVVASFGRTLSRYPGGASLVWRDAGALLGVLHLVAAEAGLSSCILGTCGLVEKRVDESIVADVGALVVGRRESQ